MKDKDFILAIICDYLNIDIEDVKSKGRSRTVVKARYFCVQLLLNEGYSHSEISNFLGRDRTTMNHATKKIKEKVTKDLIYKNQFFEIMDLIIEEKEETFSDQLDEEAEMILNCHKEIEPGL